MPPRNTSGTPNHPQIVRYRIKTGPKIVRHRTLPGIKEKLWRLELLVRTLDRFGSAVSFLGANCSPVIFSWWFVPETGQQFCLKRVANGAAFTLESAHYHVINMEKYLDCRSARKKKKRRARQATVLRGVLLKLLSILIGATDTPPSASTACRKRYAEGNV